MNKKLIYRLLIFLGFLVLTIIWGSLPSLAYTYELSCGVHTLNPYLTGCSNFTYDVMNLSDGNLLDQNQTLNHLGSNIYNGSYNFTEGNFKVIYCDNSTSTVDVSCTTTTPPPIQTGGSGGVVNLIQKESDLTFAERRIELRTECNEFTRTKKQVCLIIGGFKLFIMWPYFYIWLAGFMIFASFYYFKDNFKKLYKAVQPK